MSDVSHAHLCTVPSICYDMCIYTEWKDIHQCIHCSTQTIIFLHEYYEFQSISVWVNSEVILSQRRDTKYLTGVIKLQNTNFTVRFDIQNISFDDQITIIN